MAGGSLAGRWARLGGRVHRLLVESCRAVKGLLYPPLCLGCDADQEQFGAGFCTECLRAMIAVDRPACECCAASVGPYSDTSRGCVECRRLGLRFDHALRLGLYEGRLRDVCLQFKSVQNELLGPVLAGLFLEYLRAPLERLRPDLVVAVPLHFHRRVERGFNQAEHLARYLASGLKVPHASRILKRIRKTRPQSELRREERRENVQGAFKAKRRAKLQGATVLLVDDILTTGATCSEAARALKGAGAARVVAAVIARSQEHTSG